MPPVSQPRLKAAGPQRSLSYGPSAMPWAAERDIALGRYRRGERDAYDAWDHLAVWVISIDTAIHTLPFRCRQFRLFATLLVEPFAFFINQIENLPRKLFGEEDIIDVGSVPDSFSFFPVFAFFPSL